MSKVTINLFSGMMLSLVLAAGSARAEDPKPAPAPATATVTTTVVTTSDDCSPCHHHGFFHSFTHFWHHTVGDNVRHVADIKGDGCCNK